MNVAKIDGQEISSEEFVSWLKLTGRFGHVAEELIKQKLAAVAARKQGVCASDDELQAASDEHRRATGLHRVSDTNTFLSDAGSTLDDYEHFIEDTVLAGKMWEQITAESSVQDYFERHAPQFEAVELGHIVVDSEGKAKELLYLLQEDPDAFSELAQQLSIAESASAGGQIGRVFRGALPADLEGKLFSAEPGQPVGPFSHDQDRHEIFMVFDKQAAALDLATSEMIRKQLYDRWLQDSARKFSVEA